MASPDPGDAGATGAPIQRVSVRRNLAHMMGSQVVTWVFATGLSILIPRYLGPALSGQLRLAVSLWLIGGILMTFGTSQFLQLELARDPDRGLVDVGTVVVVRQLLFVVVLPAVLLYVWAAGEGRVVVGLVLILAVDRIVLNLQEPLAAAFVGLERMSVPATATIVTRAVSFVGTLVVIVAGGSVYLLAAVGLVGTVVAAVFLVRRFARVAQLDFGGWRAGMWRVVRRSLPFMAASAALIAYQQVDIVVISLRAPEADLGWYATADTFFGSLLFPSTILMATVFPTLGRLHAREPAELERLVHRAFSVLMLAAVPLGLGVMMIGPDLAAFIWGEDFRETGEVLVVLGPVAILTFGTFMFGAVALATGRNKVWVTVLLCSAVMTIPLDIFLVPWTAERYGNGAIGGALAYVATEAFQFAVGAIVICPFLWRRHVVLRLLRILAAGGTMVAVGWWFRSTFVWVIAVSAPVYVVALVAYRAVGDDERQVVDDLLVKLRVKR